MLDFAKRIDAVGLFWSSDSVRVFWHTYSGNKIESHEASLSALPKFGNKVQIKPLTYSSIGPCPSLLNVFAKIEDVLHGAGLSKERRYEVIFQLLLAKILMSTPLRRGQTILWNFRTSMPLELVPRLLTGMCRLS